MDVAGPEPTGWQILFRLSRIVHIVMGQKVHDIKPDSLLRERPINGHSNGHSDAGASPHQSPVKVSKLQEPRIPGWSPPNLTIKEVRDAVPPHCFERSLLRSASYLIWDLAWIGILAVAATHIDRLPVAFRYVFWPLYWYFQGAIMTGAWVIAHECGHQAFSDYKWINNTIGWIIHSAMLVPYHSWRVSHAQHHAGNAHLEKDAVFVPRTRSEYGLPPRNPARNDHDDDYLKGELWQASPLLNVLQMLRVLLLGWPVYLTLNRWGPKAWEGASHFNPKSVIFKPHHFWQIIASDIGIFITLASVGMAIYNFGLITVGKYYLVPYLIVNWWLVMITYLQHTDVTVPHYRDGEFNFLRGALCTVDRSFGILDHFFHHISDTHIAHHLFSQMPHYHAEEATRALKKVLGPYYRRDDTNVFIAMYKNWEQCRFVEDDGDVVWYKNRY
ncbi:hypothetical protein SeLEV6574_g02907 [Synchytrium endobioticum]|nr:hypothetical protein SeLEV6574_g02907 [Synchytrium endobioticum]